MSKPGFFILLFAITLSFSTFAFGQDDALRNDLKDSFRKFDLIRINNQNARRQAESNGQLSIQTSTKNFQLSLTPRDLRSPRYRAEDTTALGTRALEKGEITTFKGKVTGDDLSEARLTIDGDKVEGYFTLEGRRHFIEPANRHSEFAGKDDFIVYQEGDLLKNEPFSCHADIGEKIERGKGFIPSKTLENVSAKQVIQLATEADLLYVTAAGGASAANNEILGILNMVEGVFENELNLTISVVFQHTWSTTDTYNAATLTTLLTGFKDYWNANYFNVERDAAHLWTARPNFFNQGLAYRGTICGNPPFAYGLSGRSDWSAARHLLAGHEIGHNLGAAHAEADQSCASTLMNATLFVNTPFTFCPYSRAEISGFVSSNGGCLAVQSSSPTRFDFDNDGKS